MIEFGTSGDMGASKSMFITGLPRSDAKIPAKSTVTKVITLIFFLIGVLRYFKYIFHVNLTRKKTTTLKVGIKQKQFEL